MRKILVLAMIIALVGCGSETRGPNQPPTVRITSGPVEGTETDYRVRVGWEGQDPDGRIIRYEYASDPPLGFTEDELLRGGPGLGSLELPAQDDTPARTRVSKVVDGTSVFVDWFHTMDPNQDFHFSASSPESVCVDTTCAATGRATGCHTVYVRAVDDRDAVSEADRVAFTATTVVPETRITFPDIERFMLTVGSQVRVHVHASDEDGPSGDDRPFLYTLVNLGDLDPPISILQVGLDVFSRPDAPSWKLHEGPEPLDLFLDTPKQFVFAARSIDNAGAADPFLEWGRNATRLTALPNAGFPDLTILESTAGSWQYTGASRTHSAQVPAGMEMRFTWNASAEAYGGAMWGYSWGVDIADLEAEGPGSGWSPWGAQLLSTPQQLVFPESGPHVVYVRARDVAGATTLATLVLDVVKVTDNSGVLLVDDSRDSQLPRDEQNDAFWDGMIENGGRFEGEVVDRLSFHGERDATFLAPIELPLREMLRYRLLIWDTRGAGYNGQTGLLNSTARERSLAMYLRVRGTLWLSGRSTLAATTLSAGGTANFNYPLENGPGSFAWDFLKLFGVARNDKAADSDNNFSGATPVVPESDQQDPIYGAMDVDLSKLNPVQQRLGGTTHVDALCDVLNLGFVDGFTGVLEPLYSYNAVDPESPYQDELVAVRWHNPDPARRQGRVQWFGFQMYYMVNDQAQEVFNRTIDWFREETGP